MEIVRIGSTGYMVSDETSEQVRDMLNACAVSRFAIIETVYKKIDQGTSFDLLWKAYPNKQARPAAELEWSKVADQPATLAKIIEALEWQKKRKHWVDCDGKYVPLLATYIQQKRWTDTREKKIVAVSAETVLSI